MFTIDHIGIAVKSLAAAKGIYEKLGLTVSQEEIVKGEQVRVAMVPVGVPVKFRLTSADVVHGFLLPDTNVNTMVVPGFVAEVRTRFTHEGEYAMHRRCHAR